MIGFPLFTMYNTTPPVTATLGGGGDYPEGATFTFSWSVSNGSADAGDCYVDGTLVGSGVSGAVAYEVVSGGHTAYVVVDGITSNTVSITGLPLPTVCTLAGDGSAFAVGDTFHPVWAVDGGSDDANIYLDGTDVNPGSGSSSGGIGILLGAAGTYTLYVVCGAGSAPTSNTITIHVYDYPTTITLAGDGSSFYTGTTFTPTWAVDGGSDAADVYYDGSIAGSGGSSTVNVPLSTSGSHTLYVVATNGDTPTSNTITINVVDPPTTISLSGDGSTFSNGDTFSPAWTVDAGSDAATVYEDGSVVGSGASGSVNVSMTTGTHTFYAVATSGGSPTSNTITVSVT